MSDTDLRRWASADADIPPELGRLLRDGRADVGAADEVARLARRLSAVLGPTAGLPGAEPTAEPDRAGRDPGSPASGPRPSPGDAGHVGKISSRAAARWVGAVIATTGAVAGVWWVLARQPGDAPSAPASPATPLLGEARAPDAPPPEAPAPGVPAPDVPAAESPARAAQPPRDLSTPPARAAANRPRLATSRARVAGEARLLERAQAALDGKPAEALRLSREHEARFPRGALVQEREVIAIEALRRLGHTAAAQARAAQFERRFHGSVHAPRLERATDTSAPGGGGAATLPP